jgi:polyhydroxybutyrate depolymerase
LHGFTSTAAEMERYTGFGSKAEREGFFLATPQGLGSPSGWNADFIDLSGKHQDDVGFLSKVIDDASRQVGVDPARIYVAGHSNGAMLAYLAGSRLSSRVAAVAGFAGVIGLPNGKSMRQIGKPANPISVMVIHGVEDPMVGYSQTSGALLKGIGAKEGAEWWARCIGARIEPKITKPNKNVVIRSYDGGRDKTAVVFVTLTNGTHQWSTSGWNATDAIWTFFRTHPKA